MEGLMKGDVVIVPFPFSDLSSSKKRPALVVADLEGEDKILCQITSELKVDTHSIPLTCEDFIHGDIRFISIIKPQRLFTAHKSIVINRISSLREKKIKDVEEEIVRIFRN